MKTLIIAMLFWQEPPPIKNWGKVTETHYEVKNTIKFENKTVTATSMIGTLKILKNPELQDEFVFIVSKYPALTFLPQPIKGTQNSPDEIIIAENYFQKNKKDKLREMDLSSDVVLFIKWREQKDPRTGEKVLLGSIKNWLLDHNGKWIFEESGKSLIKIELLSENKTLVGFKFSLEEH